MTTYKRICIKTHTVTDEQGESFTLERGKEYDTSEERDDGTVMVFSTYWVRLPVGLFAGAEQFTGAEDR